MDNKYEYADSIFKPCPIQVTTSQSIYILISYYYSVNHVILTNWVLLGIFGTICWSLFFSTLYLEGTRASLVRRKANKRFEQYGDPRGMDLVASQGKRSF